MRGKPPIARPWRSLDGRRASQGGLPPWAWVYLYKPCREFCDSRLQAGYAARAGCQRHFQLIGLAVRVSNSSSSTRSQQSCAQKASPTTGATFVGMTGRPTAEQTNDLGTTPRCHYHSASGPQGEYGYESAGASTCTAGTECLTLLLAVERSELSRAREWLD